MPEKLPQKRATHIWTTPQRCVLGHPRAFFFAPLATSSRSCYSPPNMPVDWARYPPNWPLFRVEIRDARARGRCECIGECGIHRPNPHPRRCVEIHHKPARWFRGTVRLTIAHLCHCDPPCTIPDHVKAMCQRCHLRVDRWNHARKRQETRRTLRAPRPIPT